VYDFVTFFTPPIEIHGTPSPEMDEVSDRSRGHAVELEHAAAGDDGGDKNLSVVALALFSIWEACLSADRRVCASI
jgi:hypothetical protein